MKYDTDILPMYLQRVLTRENLPEADSPEHAKQEKLLCPGGEETQRRERRGTEQNPLCNRMMFQCPMMKSKGGATWCQRGGTQQLMEEEEEKSCTSSWRPQHWA